MTVSDFPFDYLPPPPRVKEKPKHREILIGARGQYTVKVSEEDYAYLMQWRWNFKKSRGGSIYARRGGGRTCGGKGKIQPTVLMHNEVMARKGEPRPTPEHTADHGDRDTLNNTRENLDWATKSEQEKNKYRKRKR